MTLRTKLISSKLVLAIVPVVVVSSIVLWRAQQTFTKAADAASGGLAAVTDSSQGALVEQGMTDLSHIAENVYATCQAQQELLQQKIVYDLNVAREILKQSGAVSFAEPKVSWEVTNQETKAVQKVDLPKMLAGTTELGQNSDAKKPSPVVDRVKELVGGTCTVFQRMNAAGDMLRVSTNVLKQDGARAIGTFIPATNGEGAANPVIAAVLNGKQYIGRAYVVNGWYVTAYEPITDGSGNVVGVLYVGVKEESASSLRQAIMSIKLGKTGYVWVINAQGTTRGHYVISKDGKRDGENIWEMKDSDGKPAIQEACKVALGLKQGEVGEVAYNWKNPEDPAARKKIVKLTYFAPWDWVIGAGAYEDEFFEVVQKMKAQGDEVLADMQQNQTAATRSRESWFSLLTLLPSLPLQTKRPCEIKY